jgi:hypothetical protein
MIAHTHRLYESDVDVHALYLHYSFLVYCSTLSIVMAG